MFWCYRLATTATVRVHQTLEICTLVNWIRVCLKRSWKWGHQKLIIAIVYYFQLIPSKTQWFSRYCAWHFGSFWPFNHPEWSDSSRVQNFQHWQVRGYDTYLYTSLDHLLCKSHIALFLQVWSINIYHRIMTWHMILILCMAENCHSNKPTKPLRADPF